MISRTLGVAGFSAWMSTDQDHLGGHLTHITASCDFPANWIENHSVQAFFEEYFPSASSVSSYQLTHQYIPQQLEHYTSAAKEKVRGDRVTLQTDGWTGINFHHLAAFMMTTSSRQVYTVRVEDISSENRTAAHLKNLIVEVRCDVEANWNVDVVAVTSDASGELRATRKQLVEQFPSLVAPDCNAHQV
ncbi:hypothetical protein CONPUDRAFT_56029 [Coniophora puteana RWD-64-598 SS2]|uniref:DUF659 domain-containing protein n=1 Tax=Coniophora puteana (strain RWD-64-598) TaxID=741705 RepID=A0A5M3MQE0_CONPW|nr:uncharacterized protein CONPUDRAFT_56029 [Coniophora puteana RWD-64-598 SS2]EIW81276.1 hypothetical protein CONPUDRAFT_56029 [Coniophora puteana RWD-64-598 SS2]